MFNDKLKQKLEIVPKFEITQKKSSIQPIWNYDFTNLVDNEEILSCINENKNNLQYNNDWLKEGAVLHAKNSGILLRHQNQDLQLEKLFKQAEQKAEKIWHKLSEWHSAYTFLLQQYLFTIYSTNQYIDWHDHGITDLVATYYVKVPKKSSNIIFLEDDRKEFQIEVKEGMCLFFPGSAIHKINPSKHEGERIIVTMNFWRDSLRPEYKSFM